MALDGKRQVAALMLLAALLVYPLAAAGTCGQDATARADCSAPCPMCQHPDKAVSASQTHGPAFCCTISSAQPSALATVAKQEISDLAAPQPVAVSVPVAAPEPAPAEAPSAPSSAHSSLQSLLCVFLI
jgi:hypothetical protein